MGSVQSSLAAPSQDYAFLILKFCDWSDRAKLFTVNQYWAELSRLNDPTWRWMCGQLATEHGLYMPTVEPILPTWRALFLEMFSLRGLWTAGLVNPGPITDASEPNPLIVDPHAPNSDASTLAKFKIGVCARFRPLSDTELDEAEAANAVAAAASVIPLHQRLQVLKARNGCTATEAQRLLWAQNGNHQDPFANALKSFRRDSDNSNCGSSSASTGKENRSESPPSKCAAIESAVGLISVDDHEVLMCAPGVGLREFTFDRVFRDATAQPEVYALAARKLVVDFFNGRNAAVICYGQTGSGKSYSMFGPDFDAATDVATLRLTAGMVPRLCADVVAAMHERERVHGVTCELFMSYVEVFGDQITDLLHDRNTVAAFAGIAARTVLQGHIQEPVHDAREMSELLARAEAVKRRAATAMNEQSTRAHAVIILSLRQTNHSSSIATQMCLADLGGSEQLKKSKATGEHLQEAIHINLGLMALNQCITALNERRKYVPYQDSKLTTLLSGALGGHSRTLFMVTGNPLPQHASETLQALRFGERCSQIAMSGKVVAPTITAQLEALDAAIHRCQQNIRDHERWETVVSRRMDNFGDGEEVVTRTVPVGAEQFHAELDALLEKKRRILAV